ncbi:hypothetical protein C1H46_007163 [Malus baccata]|uniref:Uncharacterized protein n=1 Tax=Malus baccata TaxID=106549 RepID=A0A540N9L0_MALBA|nr:hypothetical protein C1H46_007163 [Malus baccata]
MSLSAHCLSFFLSPNHFYHDLFDSENHDDHETFEVLHSFQGAIDMETNEAKNGEQPSAIDCFEAMHTNIKNGWDEEAKLKWEEMIGMKNDTTPPYGTVILTDHEIVLEVVGHKSGYFKGPS